jgi:hypothetical protein
MQGETSQLVCRAAAESGGALGRALVARHAVARAAAAAVGAGLENCAPTATLDGAVHRRVVRKRVGNQDRQEGRPPPLEAGLLDNLRALTRVR